MLRLRAIARRARDLFPLTPLGVAVALLGAGALWMGFAAVDLVMLGAGTIAGVAVVLGGLVVALGAWRLSRALRREAAATPVAIECGFSTRTGFRLPRLRWLPGVRVTWRWVDPGADVRMLEAGGWLEEEVTAHARGWSETLRRRVEIFDAFGLASIALESVEARPVRMLPSVGALKQMHVVRTLAGGGDIAHPAGTPEGDRLDLRQYTPGDPIRFVLWRVFARTRDLVVRTPEKALSAARKTLAYLVTGAADEPAAGAARVAVDVGALGGDWALGADGVPEAATTREAALEALARSKSAPRGEAGEGLARFMKRAADQGGGRAVVFVPGRPGPWLAGLAKSMQQVARDATGRAPIELIVCTDGVERRGGAGLLSRLSLREASSADDGVVAHGELNEVLTALGRLRARIVVVDRRGGFVHEQRG
jgi:hypothetical protein